MKKILTAAMVLFLLTPAYSSFAQTKTVTIIGRVTSFEESLPLEGVAVSVKGSSNGTGTQADGTFSLPVMASEKLLVFSLDGYERQEVVVTKATEYNVILKRNSSLVDKHPAIKKRVNQPAIVK